MKRHGLVLFAIPTLVVCCWTSKLPAADPSPEASPYKHHDGTPDGRKVIADSAEAVRFTLPKDGEKIAGVRIHGSRYGAPPSPNEKFVIYILNSDLNEILSAQMAPYSLFEMGENTAGKEKWVEIKFPHPITVPKDFWVLLDSHNSIPGKTTNPKGIFVSFDTSTGGQWSMIGLPWLEFQKVPADWMFELIPAK